MSVTQERKDLGPGYGNERSSSSRRPGRRCVSAQARAVDASSELNASCPVGVEVEPVLSGSMQSGGPGRQERAGGVPRFSAGISSKQPASKKEERSFCAEHEHHWDALALVFGVGNRASQTLTIRAEALWRPCAVNPVSENARYSSSENARYGATVITSHPRKLQSNL